MKYLILIYKEEKLNTTCLINSKPQNTNSTNRKPVVSNRGARFGGCKFFIFPKAKVSQIVIRLRRTCDLSVFLAANGLHIKNATFVIQYRVPTHDANILYTKKIFINILNLHGVSKRRKFAFCVKFNVICWYFDFLCCFYWKIKCSKSTVKYDSWRVLWYTYIWKDGKDL